MWELLLQTLLEGVNKSSSRNGSAKKVKDIHKASILVRQKVIKEGSKLSMAKCHLKRAQQV